MRFYKIALYIVGLVAPIATPLAYGDDAEVNTLDMITVTGKRPQKVGEVDAAISIRTGEELAEAGVTRVEQLEKVFPGLLIRDRGNRAYATVTIRGVTSPDFYNPTVQVYVDGVPQDVAYFTQELVDVERVELLRGPQGTLYGRNAHGGIINIITRQPDNKTVARISGTAADHERAAAVKISGALVPDTLFASVNLFSDKQIGHVDDIGVSNREIDDSNTHSGRLKLRYAPSNRPLDVTVSVQHDDLDSKEELYLTETAFADRQIDSTIPFTDVDPSLERKVDSYNMVVNYDFGGTTLTSITGFQDRDMDRVIFDGTPVGGNFPEEQSTLSQETRLHFSADRLDGTVGVFLQDLDFTRLSPTTTVGASTNKAKIRSYALFGEASYHLTPTVDITGGIRWSREKAEIDFDRAAPGALVFQAQESFSDVSPKLALGWQVADHHRLYLSATRGFKPGGFNRSVTNAGDNIAFDSEKSTNVELGWRAALLDNKVIISSAAYWITADDKQVFIGPLGAQGLRNLGDARSKGIELDAILYPTDYLSINIGVNHGSSKFTNAVDTATATNFSGNYLPYAPNTTGYFAVRQIIEQSALPGELSVMARTQYTSKTFFNETNTLQQDAYYLWDSSIGLDLDNGLKLSLFGRNLEDKVVRTSSFSFGGGPRSTVNEGRVIGLKAEVDF